MDLVSLLTTTTSKGNPNAYDLSKAISMPGTYVLSDITETTWTLTNDGAISAEQSPGSIQWGDNGKYFYLLGRSTDTVRQYATLTPYIISGMTAYATFSVATQENQPIGMFFKPDGTKMYIAGIDGDDINEYNLSTAWDVSTASYIQNFSVSAQEDQPGGIYFKPDGTKFFMAGRNGRDVNEYSMSTPWDISTASYVQNFSVSTQMTKPSGITFKPDGTEMYLSNEDYSPGGKEYQYSLSTAWDVSSASYGSISLTPTPVSANFQYQDLIFNNNGGFITILLTDNAVSRALVYQQWAGGSFKDVASQDTSPEDVYIKPDGTKMYVLGGAGDDVLEYNLSTPFDASTASYVQNFVVTSQEATPQGLFFKPDGTKFYICGSTNDTVYQYALSTPWDVSTASYESISKSVTAQETNPHGLTFKDDGTKMYIVGFGADTVFEYNLSSAWNVSSASYSQGFSVASQASGPRGLAFSQDGSYMFVCGPASDSAFKYTLATPWDVSTASLSQTMKLHSLIENVSGMTFDPTGTYFYFTDIGKDIVAQFQIPST